MEIEVVFFSIGIITILGYIASNIFDRTGIPDTPFLILLGFIGSITLTVGTQSLDLVAPYLAALAIAAVSYTHLRAHET